MVGMEWVDYPIELEEEDAWADNPRMKYNRILFDVHIVRFSPTTCKTHVFVGNVLQGGMPPW